MAEYLIQDTTLDAIADAINAKTGGSAAMTPAEMVTEIGNIPSGTTITDGIVYTELNSYGYPIKADIYGDVPPHAFGYYSAGAAFGTYLESVTFKTNLSKISYGAFQKTAITSITIPDSVNVIGTQAFRGNAALLHYTHENARNLYGYNAGAVSALAQCNGDIQTIQLGAVGKPLTALFYQFMTPRAYTGMTLTIYCTGANVDSFLASARQAITGGTIVFKASEATEYNGTSYAAGDTILTSEVTA